MNPCITRIFQALFFHSLYPKKRNNSIFLSHSIHLNGTAHCLVITANQIYKSLTSTTHSIYEAPRYVQFSVIIVHINLNLFGFVLLPSICIDVVDIFASEWKLPVDFF